MRRQWSSTKSRREKKAFNQAICSQSTQEIKCSQAKRKACQHFWKVRMNAEDGKKAWDALSSKERKEYTAIAKKDSKRFSTVCFLTLSLSLSLTKLEQQQRQQQENAEYKRRKKYMDLSIADGIKMRLEEKQEDLKAKELRKKKKQEKQLSKEKEINRIAREKDRLKRLKEKQEAKAEKERRKNELMWRKALEARYPIEDTLLDSEPPMTSKSIPSRPEASCRLPLRDDTISTIEMFNQDAGKLLMSWDFLHVFSKMMSLGP